VAADSKTLDPVIRYCAVGRQLGYAGYLSLDALTFLDAANIRKSPNTKRLQQEAYRCWMFGLLFSAVSGTYSLYNLKQQQSRIDKKDGEGAIATKRIEKYVSLNFGARERCCLGIMRLTSCFRERSAVRTQLISDLCDLAVPTTALGFTSFDDGLVGLAGTTSSLIGVYSQWKKTA
jgi:peroxin-11B